MHTEQIPRPERGQIITLDFLDPQKNGLKERKEQAREALGKLVKEKIVPVYQRISPAQAVELAAQCALRGYFALPRQLLTGSQNHGFTYGRGPFVEYLATKDISELKEKILALELPATTLTERKKTVPGATVGIRFGTYRGTRYSASLLDLLDSQRIVNQLRPFAQIDHQRSAPGDVLIECGGDIELRIHGLHPQRQGVLDAELAGFPSREDPEEPALQHNPKYQLEALFDKPALGVFSVSSGYDQQHRRNWTVLLNHKGRDGVWRRVEQKPQTDIAATVERESLHLGDLVGLRIIDSYARKSQGVNINQPLPVFPEEYLRLAERVVDSAFVIEEDGSRNYKKKTDLNIALGLLLASSQREALLEKAGKDF